MERRVYEKEGALVESLWDGFNSFVLLRLRGFLHALHLVEMTTKRRYLKSSEVAQLCEKDFY